MRYCIILRLILKYQKRMRTKWGEWTRRFLMFFGFSRPSFTYRYSNTNRSKSNDNQMGRVAKTAFISFAFLGITCTHRYGHVNKPRVIVVYIFTHTSIYVCIWLHCKHFFIAIYIYIYIYKYFYVYIHTQYIIVV